MYVLGMLERLLNSADMLHLYLNAIRRLKMCRVWTITKTSSKFSICNLSMMSKLKLRWVIYLILIGHKGATELRRAKTFIPMYFFFHYCQSWSKFDTSGNKFHAYPIWDLGAVHKLRLQEEGGRWSKKSTFCKLLYHRKCKRRGVGGQKKPNLVNVVCERPLIQLMKYL